MQLSVTVSGGVIDAGTEATISSFPYVDIIHQGPHSEYAIVVMSTSNQAGETHWQVSKIEVDGGPVKTIFGMCAHDAYDQVIEETISLL